MTTSWVLSKGKTELQIPLSIDIVGGTTERLRQCSRHIDEKRKTACQKLKANNATTTATLFFSDTGQSEYAKT